ncbi:hypothetical protein HY633_00950 [Candidatus Uhrbacteria bacterium]|nr:hypothetical protein [Candidatus Uhrbacteria bacterium]
MTTRFIGMKDFRQNMASIMMTARKKNQRLIVLRKNQPMFELLPLDPEQLELEKFLPEIEAAREEIRQGKFYTLEEVRKKLRLKKL